MIPNPAPAGKERTTFVCVAPPGTPLPYRLTAPRHTLVTVKIYTRTGDTGETSLRGGARVPKSHPRVAACGDLDELTAAIGVAAATDPRDLEGSLVETVQRDLYSIAARLADPGANSSTRGPEKIQVTEAQVVALEAAIDRISAELPRLQAFVLPGGTTKAALLHFARTVCRRAERSVVELSKEEQVPGDAVPYLNRLGDLLFTLARLASHRAGIPDRTW